MDTFENCQQITQHLDAFRDSELSKEDAEAVSKHLHGCLDCLQHLASIDKVVQVLHALPSPAVSERLCARLDAIADNAPAKSGSPLHIVDGGSAKLVPHRLLIWAPVAAAAAVMAIVLGSRFLLPETSPHLATRPNTPANAPMIARSNPPSTGKHEAENPAPLETADAELPPVATAVISHHHAAAAAPAHLAIRHEAQLNMPSHTVAPPPAEKLIAHLPHPSEAPATSSPTPPPDETVAELPPSTPGSFNESMGIATDKDGLYDIKM